MPGCRVWSFLFCTFFKNGQSIFCPVPFNLDQLRTMAPEMAHLVWNEFSNTAVKTFQNLRSDSHFADVTLASSDGQQLLAHKVVLSSCSNFFRDVLVRNPHQHPLLYLKGIGIEDLRNIIKFIYSGEVEVESNTLSQFLEAANELKIDGLKQPEKETRDIVKPRLKLKIKVPKALEEVNYDSLELDTTDEDDNIIEERIQCVECYKVFMDKTNLRRHEESVHGKVTSFENEDDLMKHASFSDDEGKGELVIDIKSELGEERKRIQCSECTTTFTRRDNLRVHMKNLHGDEHVLPANKTKESIKTEVTFEVNASNKTNVAIKTIESFDMEKDRKTCDLCDYEGSSVKDVQQHRREEHPGQDKFFCIHCSNQFSSLDNLMRHKLLHSGVRFDCDQCEHKASSKYNLSKHVARKHAAA